MNTKINNANFQQYRNAEFHTFHYSAKILMENAVPSLLGIDELFPDYAAAIGRYEKSLTIINASLLTPEIEKADELRDKRYSAFSTYVRTHLYDENPEKLQAANKIMYVISNTGNPTHLGLDAETSVIKSLNEKLQPYTAELQLLGAAERLTALVSANNVFEDLQIQRYNSEGSKGQSHARENRKEIEILYKKVRERINALIVVNGYAPYQSFVESHNEEIKKYADAIAQRQGRLVSKKVEK